MTSGVHQDAPETATPRQKALAAALLTMDLQTAAAAVGINRCTARKWRQLAAVKAEISRLTDLIMADAAGRVAGHMVNAADILAAIMGDHAQPPGARVAAAARLLDVGPKLKDTSDLADRLQALEALEERAQERRHGYQE